MTDDEYGRRCVVIGASPETDIKLLRRLVREDDHIVCADGGYLHAEKAGLKPELIIGDFDSSEKPEKGDYETVTLPGRKDDTDTMYVLKEYISRGFRRFLLLGMTGGRPDHTYANLTALSYLCSQGARGEIADQHGNITMTGRGIFCIEGKKGVQAAVFPFGCERSIVSLRGFEYELQDGELKEDFPLGVSNRITDDHAEIEVIEGKVLIYILDGE